MIANLIQGLVLGGTYSLVALGLTLQYGVARIMNLAFGEITIAASFVAFVLFSSFGLSPLIALVFILPGGFVVSYVIYAVMMRPLVDRAQNKGSLEIDTILVSFGLLFVVQGVMLAFFGGNFTGYTYLNLPVEVFGAAISANRLVAFLMAVVLGVGFYLAITRTRWGTVVRAVAFRPEYAPLVGIDVNRTARLAFAIGGGLAAAGGVAISMYQTFTATAGVAFTMKALIVVIMGGVGNLMGALLAGFILGLVETFVAAYVDPGLTLAASYFIFLVVLLWRPAGLFGKAAG